MRREVLRNREERCRAGRIVIGSVEDDSVPRSEVIVVRTDDDVPAGLARSVNASDDIYATVRAAISPSGNREPMLVRCRRRVRLPKP